MPGKRTGARKRRMVELDEDFLKGVKKCTKCLLKLPLEDFPKSKTDRRTGRYSWCKKCTASYNVSIRSRYRLNKNRAGREARRKLREEVLSHYSEDPFEPRCSCCLEARLEFLALDHVQGGGNKHKQEVRHIYKWAKGEGFPPIFRVLCHNCNQALGAYGYCPHDKEKESSGNAIPQSRTSLGY